MHVEGSASILALIELNHLTKTFKGKTQTVDALKDINLHIEQGDIFGIIGMSGAGKSTLVRCINFLEQPTSGSVVIDGKDLASLSPKALRQLRQQVSMIFQHFNLLSQRDVRGNIAFAMEIAGMKRPQIEKRIDELLEIVGLTDRQHNYPSQLSGGQQQRVAIARTLAPSPKVLFMDEPLSNLDAKLRQEMRTELKRLHSDTNSTFVYVTHDQLEAMTLSTKVCLMDTGVLQQYAPPLEIYGHPANLFVAEFVGNPTMNFIPATVKAADGNRASLSLLGHDATFTAKAPLGELTGSAVLGVRPEFLPIVQGGPLRGKTYSTLPAGMETTVKLSCGGTMLTSVVFGCVDYAVDTELPLNIVGDNIALFDQASGQSVGFGSVTF